MAQRILCLLILSLTIFSLNSMVDSLSRARAYVEMQCRSTVYPDQCIRTLLPYVNSTSVPNPQQLARISLTSCLVKARFTKTYVNMVAKQFSDIKNVGGYDQSMVDCLSQINDGVSQIAQSVEELKKMEHDGEDQFMWHESNVQSWVSAAMTDVTSCLDGISGNTINSRQKGLIKARVMNLKQITSNSLALFSRFTARHHASRSTKNPKI